VQYETSSSLSVLWWEGVSKAEYKYSPFSLSGGEEKKRYILFRTKESGRRGIDELPLHFHHQSHSNFHPSREYFRCTSKFEFTVKTAMNELSQVEAWHSLIFLQ
jgi:hypothetical protein